MRVKRSHQIATAQRERNSLAHSNFSSQLEDSGEPNRDTPSSTVQEVKYKIYIDNSLEKAWDLLSSEIFTPKDESSLEIYG